MANHVSVLDPVACGRLVFDNGRTPRFLAKDSLFTGFLGTLLRAAGQIPVARNSTHASGSVSAAQVELAKGDLIIIYPEGTVTRDPDWWPMQGRTGVARLALTTDAASSRWRSGGRSGCTTTTPRSGTCGSGRRPTTWWASRSTSTRCARRSGPAAR